MPVLRSGPPGEAGTWPSSGLYPLDALRRRLLGDATLGKASGTSGWNMRMIGRFVARAVFVGSLSLVSSCALLGLGKEEPEPTELEIKPPAENGRINFLATASPLLNPGPTGTPTPVVLRLYFLTAPGPFSEANFFELWEQDAATLGPTMLAKQELFLEPSDVQRVTADLPPETLMVGVTAGFRDFESAKWRAIVPMQGQKTLRLRAELLSNAVNLGPQT